MLRVRSNEPKFVFTYILAAQTSLHRYLPRTAYTSVFYSTPPPTHLFQFTMSNIKTTPEGAEKNPASLTGLVGRPNVAGRRAYTGHPPTGKAFCWRIPPFIFDSHYDEAQPSKYMPVRRWNQHFQHLSMIRRRVSFEMWNQGFVHAAWRKSPRLTIGGP